ncbi:MAG: hypothetical protein AAFY88_23110, partial [Acidobacteriota bacterium]
MASGKASSKSAAGKSSTTIRRPGGRNLRRPPAGGLALFRYRTRMVWRRMLEMPILWLAIFITAGAWMLLPQRLALPADLAAGDIAHRTWIADRDLSVVDEAATKALVARARQDVLPVYDLDLSLEAERRRQLGSLFEAGRALMAAPMVGDDEPTVSVEEGAVIEDEGDPLRELNERLSSAAGFRIEGEAATVLVEKGFQNELEDRLGGVLTRLLRIGVVADKSLLLEHRERGITLRSLPMGR